MHSKLVIAAVTILQILSGSYASPFQGLAQDGYTRFIGLSSSKALFAIMVKGDWEYVANYCHTYKMLAASIDDQAENDMVMNYLSASSEIDSFWLPATDYISEGTFAWIRTKTPVEFVNWQTGSPSIDRTKNCVAIQKDGTWTEELCTSLEVTHYGLCELPLLAHGSAKAAEKRLDVQKSASAAAAGNSFSLEQLKSIKMESIGQVGNKQYFKDETLTMRKMYQSLDFCHQNGMRLVTPETPEEFEFLGDYSRQMQQENQDSIFLTSGSDTLSVGCNRGNAFYRWFYSPDQVQLEGDFPSNWWYRCLAISPENFFTPDCIGMITWTLCELNMATVY